MEYETLNLKIFLLAKKIPTTPPSKWVNTINKTSDK